VKDIPVFEISPSIAPGSFNNFLFTFFHYNITDYPHRSGLRVFQAGSWWC